MGKNLIWCCDSLCCTVVLYCWSKWRYLAIYANGTNFHIQVRRILLICHFGYIFNITFPLTNQRSCYWIRISFRNSCLYNVPCIIWLTIKNYLPNYANIRIFWFIVIFIVTILTRNFEQKTHVKSLRIWLRFRLKKSSRKRCNWREKKFNIVSLINGLRRNK